MRKMSRWFREWKRDEARKKKNSGKVNDQFQSLLLRKMLKKENVILHTISITQFFVLAGEFHFFIEPQMVKSNT